MEKSEIGPINLTAAVLDQVQRSPLDRIPADRVAGIVHRIVNRKPASAAVDVARFNSAI